MESNWAVILGALVGAFAGVLPGLINTWVTRRQDRKATAAALAGEIATIVELTRTGGYVEKADEIRAMLQAGTDIAKQPFADERLDVDPVYAEHLGKLGLLPAEAAGDVVRFYRYIKAMRFHAIRLSAPELAGNTAAKLDDLERAAALWPEVETLGISLAERLKKA